MQVRIRLKDRVRNDGQQLLLFDFHINGERRRLSSEIYVLAEAWDIKHEEIKKSKNQFNSQGLNDLLQNKKKVLINAYYTAQAEKNLTIENVINIYNSIIKGEIKKKEDGISLLDYFEYYLVRFKNLKKHNTLRKGNQVYLKLKEFNPKIDWHNLTESFWIDYSNWLIEKHKLSGSTINRHGIEISIRCKEAQKEFKNLKIPTDHEKFSFKSFQTQPFWATWEEVQQISKAKTLSKSEEYVRDNFTFTCNTGLRNSDSFVRKTNYFRENGKHYLRVVQTKTGFDYNLQLNKTAIEILEKYDFNLPINAQGTNNLYIKRIAKRTKLARMPYEKIDYVGTAQIVKTVKRADMFTTHTARRTFARHWLNQGGSLVVLSKILGHRSTDITMKYAGFTAKEVSSEFELVFSSNSQ